MQIRKYIPILLSVLFIFFSTFSQAQCAMCKGSVQTSQYAKSINDGIEYLLLAPVILVAAIIFLWIKNKDKFAVKEN